jgi:hypothetical protein
MNDHEYRQLQHVLLVRDTLLRHVYTLLGRPNGILLKDMRAAVTARMQEIEALRASQPIDISDKNSS